LDHALTAVSDSNKLFTL